MKSYKVIFSIMLLSIVTNSFGAQFFRRLGELYKKVPVATAIGLGLGYKKWKERQDFQTRRPSSHSFSAEQVEEMHKIARRQGIKGLQICDIEVAFPRIDPTITRAMATIMQGQPTICLSKKSMEDLVEGKGREEALFVLSHEVAHLKKPEESKKKYRLVIATTSLPFVAWQCARFSGYGRIISGLVGLATYQTGTSLGEAFSRKIEKATDLRAVTADPERIKGGIQYFENRHSQNAVDFQYYKECIAFCGIINAIKVNNAQARKQNIPLHIILDRNHQLLKIHFSSSVEELEEKIDPRHPTPSERAKYLKELAEKLEKESK